MFRSELPPDAKLQVATSCGRAVVGEVSLISTYTGDTPEISVDWVMYRVLAGDTLQIGAAGPGKYS